MKKIYQLKIDRDDVIEMLNRYSHLEFNLSTLVTHYSGHKNYDIIQSIILVIKRELQRIREINLEISDEEYRELTHLHMIQLIEDDINEFRFTYCRDKERFTYSSDRQKKESEMN